jgi:glutaredoxin
MKSKFILLFTFACCNAFTQSDIEITEERDAKFVKLFATNNLDEEVLITFNLDLLGFTTTTIFPVKKTLAAKQKAEMASLSINSETDCSYESSVSYTKKVVPKKLTHSASASPKLTNIQMNTNKVNVFTKDGCGRCTFVIKYLEDNKIPYVELNTSAHEPNNDLMFDELQKSGFKSGSVSMPVVIYNGKTSYSITNLQEFVKTLK